MNRRSLFVALIAAFLCLLPGVAPRDADAQAGETTTLRIATLAPRGSPWHRVFMAWNNTLRERTGGRLELQIFPGGSQGDERDFIRKIRIHQLEGAAVTSIGLGLVVRPVLVLQAPGIFSDYAQLDRARTGMDSEFRGLFADNGMQLIGWGDVGRGRIFSNRPILQPTDPRSVRPWVPTDDAMFTEFLSVIGANGVRLGIPEVLPGLSTGQIDTVVASATAASALQWHTRLTHVTQQQSSILVGATIISKERFDALPAALQTALTETGTQAHATLVRPIRRDDDRYFTALTTRHGMTAVDASAHEAAWRDVARQTRERLVGRLYPRDLLDRVQAAAAGR